MTKPTRARRLGAAAAVATAVTAVSATGLAAAAPASAAVRSPWTQLSTGEGVGLSAEPSVARWGQQLVTAWAQTTSPTSESLHTRVLDRLGRPAGAIGTVATWSDVTDPSVLTLAGVPTVVFGGLRSLDTNDPYTGPMAYAQAPDATSWSLGAGSLTQTHDAYGAYGLGAVDDGTGSPVVALAASSTDHVTVHHGIDPAVPAAAPDEEVAGTVEAQQVNLAKDPLTGNAYAVWYAARDEANEGVRAAQVWPTVGAPTAPAPLSTVAFQGARESVNPGQRVAVAGRVGGGVWAAYASGYPSAHRLVLWDVVSGRTLSLPRRGAVQYVGLSPAPGGRLWVWWVEGPTVYAARTNPAVTAFGAVRAVAAPGGWSPTRTAGDGSLGPLDVVVNSAADGVHSQIRTTRILEALTVTVSPSSLATTARRRAVTVSVTDAGVPVAGATVRVGPRTAVTGRGGRARLVVPRTPAGTTTVVARAAGYAPGSAPLRVR
ncbi:hypothetical protein CLV35_2873 [Motilibacter peucedani]|uniref:Carboxypeptidase family protein n=1 Tax=Motilibacter peucedani TaxID=598650 RepID=A0A420XMX7_9ACTN|nr:carboxypeptidase-like regulatory domain-containing protein [Motilibacter peucedani]RKS72626.1 hypothetical protein CLV35_2873 [Motilibacter peucedani]